MSGIKSEIKCRKRQSTFLNQTAGCHDWAFRGSDSGLTLGSPPPTLRQFSVRVND